MLMMTGVKGVQNPETCEGTEEQLDKEPENSTEGVEGIGGQGDYFTSREGERDRGDEEM